MVIAPHHDDEALACSVILQQAVRAGAAIRIVYVTDGDDNPWAAASIRKKMELESIGSKTVGKIAARRSPGCAARSRYLPCERSIPWPARPGPNRSFVARLRQSTHANHSSDRRLVTHRHLCTFALRHSPRPQRRCRDDAAHLRRLFGTANIALELFGARPQPCVLRPRRRIIIIRIETAKKREAIRCHQTQIKLSRQRFLRYAARPERFLRVDRESAVRRDGAVYSVCRARDNLDVDLRFSADPFRMQRNKFFILGRDSLERTRTCQIRLPSRSADLEMLDCATNRSIGIARYRGHPFAGEFTLPLHLFSPIHDLFIKVDRRSWFFDEAGWIAIPGVPNLASIALSMISAEAHSFAVR